MHRIAAWRAAIGLVAVISSCEVCGHGNDLSSAAEGRTLYETNGCVSCHGLQGHGDGPVGKTLTPAPRDFRGAGAFKNGTDVVAIARTLAMGLSGNGGRMPQFGHLTEVERRSIALFVISLRENGHEEKKP
ncbi:MAG TPA: cytochrome c [Vicinamibacterales bacterium]|jgi:high-affinity iron transporter|nr:cytochrome c [Vicinamibacterales bacterium]